MTIATEETEQTIAVSDQPARLSPLHAKHRMLGAQFADQAGWQLPEAYTSAENETAAVRERVGVADVSAAGKLIVKGDAAGELLAEAFGVAPASPGDVSPAALQDEAGQPVSQVYVAQLTADEFLVLAPPGAERSAAQCLKTQIRSSKPVLSPVEGSEIRNVTVVNQTSGLAGLVVAGPDSRELLGKLCALPFDPANFPNHHVAQSSLAKVHTVILRNDLSDLPAFELYFDRPYAEYVWESVMDAGNEFGIMPFGAAVRELLDAKRET